jgi:hypothetical protein
MILSLIAKSSSLRAFTKNGILFLSAPPVPVLRGFSRSVKQDSETSAASGGVSAANVSPWRSTVRVKREKSPRHARLSYGEPVFHTKIKIREN